MVNSDEFAVRLKNIMSEYELSATDFADKIGVGRSSISHILSGRNKPSLDFIMKVLEAFPKVDLYWLMNGESSNRHLKQRDINRPQEKTAPKLTTPVPSSSVETNSNPSPNKFPFSESDKPIKRIIIFYEDGSFESFSN